MPAMDAPLRVSAVPVMVIIEVPPLTTPSSERSPASVWDQPGPALNTDAGPTARLPASVQLPAGLRPAGFAFVTLTKLKPCGPTANEIKPLPPKTTAEA